MSDITLGHPSRRRYLDATGRALCVGDFVTYATRQGSNAAIHFGRIKELVDTSTPLFIGYGDKLDDGSAAPRVSSWDYAYKLKLIPYQYSRVRSCWMPHRKWVKMSAYPWGYWEDVTEDEVKVRTITAIERVIRLDLDV